MIRKVGYVLICLGIIAAFVGVAMLEKEICGVFVGAAGVASLFTGIVIERHYERSEEEW